jgi:glutathione S-transferase
MPVIIVHHLNNSRSQRVLWLLEELGVAYEVKRYERDPNTLLAPPELLAVHPLGKSPVITDGDLTVAESGAIVEYLVGKYGGGRLIPPAGSPERMRYTYWLHYAEGSAMPPLLLKLVFDRMSKAPIPWPFSAMARRIAAGVKSSFVQPQLTRTWFAGEEFSAADIQMSFPLEAAAARAGLDSSRPKLFAFLSRIHTREPYKRALQRGGPYAY